MREGLIDNDQLALSPPGAEGSNDKLARHSRQAQLRHTKSKLIAFLSRQYGIQSITLSQLDIDPEVLKLAPEQIARKYESGLPIKRQGNQITLAMADPTNVFALDDVGFMTNLQVVPVVASQAAIRAAVDRCYDATGSGMAEIVSEMAGAAADVELVEGEEEISAEVDVFELKESADEAPVVRLINMILVDADPPRGFRASISEPYEEGLPGSLPRGRCAARDRDAPSVWRPPSPRGSRSWRAWISRAAAAPGRSHQAAFQPARDRLPRLHPAHDLRREDGHAYSRQRNPSSST
mgnify:CR=1 FL=1